VLHAPVNGVLRPRRLPLVARLPEIPVPEVIGREPAAAGAAFQNQPLDPVRLVFPGGMSGSEPAIAASVFRKQGNDGGIRRTGRLFAGRPGDGKPHPSVRRPRSIRVRRIRLHKPVGDSALHHPATFLSLSFSLFHHMRGRPGLCARPRRAHETDGHS